MVETKKTEKKVKASKSKVNGVQLVNPKQTAYTSVETFENKTYVFFKDTGYIFSNDKAMEKVVKHFKDRGFKTI